MRNNVGYLLAKRALLHPEKEALIDVSDNKRLTYTQFNSSTNRAAHGLTDMRIRKGDRVGVLLSNCVEYMVLFFAIAKVGAVCVPLNSRLVTDELVYILNDSGARALAYGNEFRRVVADIRTGANHSTSVATWLYVGSEGEPNESDISFERLASQAPKWEPERQGYDEDALFIMYTPGTKGYPKGVVHTHNSTIWESVSMASTWEMRQDDRFFICMPLFHGASLMPAIMSIFRGNSVVMVRAFDPSLYWKIIASERVTNSLMVPTVLTMMLQAPEKNTCDFSSFRWAAVGGAPVPASLLQAYADMGIRLEQVYGLTEAGPVSQLMGEDAARKLGSTGKPLLFSEVRVVDTNDQEVPPGVPGELVLQGPNLMREYWNLPEETAHTLRGGWLHTGDLATVDEEGFIYIVDRLKDMIISGGENIDPAEIEQVIRSMPQVSQVAVIGQPDPKWGETPLALIVRQDVSLDEERVISFCEGKLARYKIPKSVIFKDSLPLTPTGQVQKAILRARLVEGS
jgi:acyl-CoA synthetase (AMP-forming)/AMP-acid ligase II